MERGIIIVDHGSRLAESNALLEQVAAAFHARDPEKYPIVEPAHMELAEPTIAQAYDRCAARGAGPATDVSRRAPRGQRFSTLRTRKSSIRVASSTSELTLRQPCPSPA